MQVEAAVVEVDGAHGGHAVVAQPGLGVQKARCVAVDAHARLQQVGKVAARQKIDRGFVGRARRIDAHIDAALGRQPQRGQQVVVQDQVGRADVQPPLRLGDEVQVDVFGYRLAVGGAVGKRLHQAVGGLGGRFGQQRGQVHRLLGVAGFPKRQKDVGKAARGGAFHPDGAVFPVAEPLELVDVLVGQVDAAGKGDARVDDGDLAVVAVVHDQVEHRHERVERERADALGAQGVGIIVGQQAQTARVVIDHAHIDAGGGLAAQDLMDAAPHLAHADDETLDIDAVLGAFQRGQQVGEHRLAALIVAHGGAVKHRRGGKVPHVARGLGGAGVARGQFFLGGGVGGAQRGQHGLGALQPAAQGQRGAFVAPQQVEQPALHRHDGKQNHPADLELRHGGVLPDKRQAHDHAERDARAADPGRVFAQARKQDKKPYQLRQQQHAGDDQAAEYQRKDAAHHMAPGKFVAGHRHLLAMIGAAAVQRAA